VEWQTFTSVASNSSSIDDSLIDYYKLPRSRRIQSRLRLVGIFGADLERRSSLRHVHFDFGSLSTVVACKSSISCCLLLLAAACGSAAAVSASGF
jgi:hypothetical protein